MVPDCTSVPPCTDSSLSGHPLLYLEAHTFVMRHEFNPLPERCSTVVYYIRAFKFFRVPPHDSNRPFENLNWHIRVRDVTVPPKSRSFCRCFITLEIGECVAFPF